MLQIAMRLNSVSRKTLAKANLFKGRGKLGKWGHRKNILPSAFYAYTFLLRLFGVFFYNAEMFSFFKYENLVKRCET